MCARARARMCVCVCVCLHACVCERARERACIWWQEDMQTRIVNSAVAVGQYKVTRAHTHNNDTEVIIKTLQKKQHLLQHKWIDEQVVKDTSYVARLNVSTSR